MNAESIIKSRIAEGLVELMLEESGYKITRIAHEGLVTGVRREDAQMLDQSGSAGKIVTAPSFAVIKDKDAHLLRVKYKASSKRGANISHGIGQLEKYWPEAKLVVVTNEEPYFFALNKKGNLFKIEEMFSGISRSTISKYQLLVRKFLRESKS